MEFPTNYPFSPPSFKFTPSIFHPNVYPDGRVCISILHESGNVYQDEPSNENWSPAQCVESVILSIISILDDPNIQSPANIDASNMWRDNRETYNAQVKKFVDRSQQNIPADFDVPSDNLFIGNENQEEEDEWFFEDDSDEDDEDQMSYEEDEAEMSEDYNDEDDK